MRDGLVIAAAGRRIDAANAETRGFPLHRVEPTRARIRETLIHRRATALVSSAACGADLVALLEAGSLQLRRRVVLPFDRERFKTTSVLDRPGDWVTIFDTVIDQIDAAGELIVLGESDGDAAYAATNDAILDEAERLALAAGAPAAALLVWEGHSRPGNDLTEQFRASAARRHFEIWQVLTL